VANRPDWLADPEHWQGVTRAVEDKLSDALHERLTERFVDRRTSTLMRRLRENATLEPQINKTGEVIVEGHVIGRLDGFVFVADASAGGSEARALHNAAQKALAGEIGTRATQLGAAADEQFVLASDGVIRWTGAAVGKLGAGEDVLRPKVRLIADEQLTGAPRDAVAARLDAFIKSHLEKLLGPLFVLGAAEDVTGIARGVAFQLIEALGVLDRAKVADEVKGLEQPARATLRKYGVRFGAYHIYIPALLKPGPRVLAAQLWALAHDGPQSKSIDDLLHLAGSGRTSIPVNKEIEAVLYGTAGYRVCGERAVRVDILERLADLIRPALSWREGAAGSKPPGAIVGGGFTVFNGMTSLTGASGEDFASILRALGYRMERRPKPAEPPAPVEPAVAPAPPPSESSDEAAAAMVEAADMASPDPLPAGEESEIQAPDNAGLEDALQPTPDAVVVAPAADLQSAPPAPEIVAADVAADAAQADPAPAEPAAPAAEPEMVEVWRPGRAARPEGRRRPRFRRRDADKATDRPSTPRSDEAAAPLAAAATEAGAAAPAEQTAPAQPDEPRRHRRHRGRPGGEHRVDRSDRPDRGDRQDRPDRPQRDRDRPPSRAPRPARFDRRERDKAPDPNSPFAKLAALKAQLEADAKERH
jgi:ATP-dependent RNA helicase SUPV3L1/SUV3